MVLSIYLSSVHRSEHALGCEWGVHVFVEPRVISVFMPKILTQHSSHIRHGLHKRDKEKMVATLRLPVDF
jgi:hypothetical protein